MGDIAAEVREKQTIRLAKGPFHRFLRSIGSGVITGAADDDPWGIGTYSQAGAQLGSNIGWTMIFTFPLMAAIQEIAARIGRTTGRGISGNLSTLSCRTNVFCGRLVVGANVINIGADLSAMADGSN